MADKDLEVIKKTKALVKRTYQVTSNSKHYPKKYRYSLVAEMQKRSMDIYKLLFEANRMNIKVSELIALMKIFKVDISEFFKGLY